MQRTSVIFVLRYMETRFFKILMILAGAALCTFLAIQIHWFREAKHLQESQFNQHVNLALRSVADNLLSHRGDFVSRISPVKQLSGNTFEVRLKTFISYTLLDSLIKSSFQASSITTPYHLSIHDDATDSLLVGGFYEAGIKTDSVACLSREQVKGTMNFVVSFPEKQIAVLNGMQFWTYSALAFLCLLIVFGYLIFDLSRQNKLAKMKTDFVNNMTHELQTPIANISMASEVLRSGKIDDAKKTEQYLDIIFQENQRLKLHVEQVLQTARLERGELPMNKNKVDVHTILEEVISKFQLRLRTKGGHLTLERTAAKTLVLGDQVHLSNLFYNLLDNADKYSPLKTEIKVTTKNHQAGIEVSIVDHGMGIRKDDQPMVFDKFFRASGGNLHDIKGFGMGLTYVREIVKAHGGMVSLTSEEHKGSSFNVWLQNC
jgi:two-component system, OmpR family, phosphate regulon sensor histidine kinase PhoR